MAFENVLVYRIVTGDNTYPHSGNFTIEQAGQITVDDSDGSDDAIFGDFTHTGGADQPDQDVSASTVTEISNGDLVDLRYKYTFTGSDGSSGTVYFIATNGAANYGPLMVSETPLDPSVTYTFGTFNTDGAVAYDDLVPCFTPGTWITTMAGEKRIETLSEGDMILTRDSGFQPLRWIGKRTVLARGKLAPIRFEPGLIGNSAALLVSPNHRILIEGYSPELLFGEPEVLVAAKHLLSNKGTVVQCGGRVTYIHMLFDSHQIVFSNGASSESLFPAELALGALSHASVKEVYSLFPELFREGLNNYGNTARMCLRTHEALAMQQIAA